MRANKLGTRLVGVVLALLMVITIMPITSIKAKAADGVDGFVNRCYEVSLGRTGDAEGINYWINEINSKKRTGVDVVYNFIFSKEYEARNRSNTEFVTDLYTMFMGRTPDQDGYNYWCGQMEAGKSRKDIFTGFANSKEFYETCTNYGVTAGYYTDETDGGRLSALNLFVGRMYETTLGRLGDQEGQNYWTKGLMNGELTGTDCAANFIKSKEFTNLKLSNEDYVDKLYAAFMGRTADAEGRTNWVTLLNEGDMTRDEVFACFANSAEFKGICQTYGITSYDYQAEEYSQVRVEEMYSGGILRRHIELVPEGKYQGYIAAESEYDEEGNLLYAFEIKYEGNYSYETSYNSKREAVAKSVAEFNDDNQCLGVKYYEMDGTLKEGYRNIFKDDSLTEEWYDASGRVYATSKYLYDENRELIGYQKTKEGVLVTNESYSLDSEGRSLETVIIRYDDTGKTLLESLKEKIVYSEDGSYIVYHYSSGKLTGKSNYSPDGYERKGEDYAEDEKTIISNRICEVSADYKEIKTNFYENGKLTSVAVLKLNAKGGTKSYTTYDNKGNVTYEETYIYTY